MLLFVDEPVRQYLHERVMLQSDLIPCCSGSWQPFLWILWHLIRWLNCPQLTHRLLDCSWVFHCV